MATNKTENEKLAPIIIKRVKKVAGGHHGGAWKVAYADFVTAMMAFFLLMWLLNVTTNEQKNAISNYFDPTHPRVSDTTSGAGGLLGGLSVSPDGAMVSTVQPISQPEVNQTSTRGAVDSGDYPEETPRAEGGLYDTLDMNEEQLEAELRKLEDARFEQAADQLREDIAKAEELEGLQEHVLVDITPEGLRIQIVDDQGRSMFPSGSAAMHGFMRDLLLKVSGVIAPMPNQVSVRGHTDSVRYRDPARYDNWNLSADRAQSSRRVLVEGGLAATKIENVMGRADRDPLLLDDPSNPRNRRISVILLREAPKLTKPADAAPKPATSTAPTTNRATGNTTGTTPPALQIVDDTNTGTGNGTGTGTGGAQPRQTQQQGRERALERPAPALPVQSDSRPRPATQPQVQTFDDTANGTATGGFANKPPTIQTPVFNFGKKAEPKAPEIAPDTGATKLEPAPAPTPRAGASTPNTQLTFP